MRKVNIESVRLGLKLARTILTSDGRVLLAKGIELKECYLNRLKMNGVSEVYLDDDISSGKEAEDVIQYQTRNEAVAIVKKTMNDYPFSSSLDVGRVKKMVNKIIDELLLNNDIIYDLSDIKSVDDYTFEHSVNVCILSLITGIGLGFDVQQLRELGIGAMMHDIGKLHIPQEILKKPSQLTAAEFEEIQKHTVYGYDMMKKSGKVNPVSAYIALGHHERYDGSGYPLKLKNDNIQICARIVAVADVYDALTSDRVYKKKLMPNVVYEYITSLRVNIFDPRVIESFVKYVTIYPVGTGVLLNTGERGLVVENNIRVPTRPVVRIAYDDGIKRKNIFKEINLSKQTNIFITSSCEV